MLWAGKCLTQQSLTQESISFFNSFNPFSPIFCKKNLSSSACDCPFSCHHPHPLLQVNTSFKHPINSNVSTTLLRGICPAFRSEVAIHVKFTSCSTPKDEKSWCRSELSQIRIRTFWKNKKQHVPMAWFFEDLGKNSNVSQQKVSCVFCFFNKDARCGQCRLANL